MKNNQTNGNTFAEKVIARSGEFILRYGNLRPSDFETAENLASVIEFDREMKNTPMVGDLVSGAYYDGRHPYKYGIITNVNGDKVTICAHPYTPFTRIINGKISLSVSGGPFISHDVKELRHVCDNVENNFCFFGSEGACAGGAVVFPAGVRSWEIPYTPRAISYIRLKEDEHGNKFATCYYGGGSMFQVFDGTFEHAQHLAEYLGFSWEACDHDPNHLQLSHNFEEALPFWELSDVPEGAKPLRAYSNGSPRDCYAYNDGFTITIYRPNSNSAPVYVDSNFVNFL